MSEERFLNVTTSFDDWRYHIDDHIDDMGPIMNSDYFKIIFLGSFMKCDFYMTRPVGICEYETITAKSILVKDDQEIIDLINTNDNIIPYMYFEETNRTIFRYAEYKVNDADNYLKEMMDKEKGR